MCTEGEGDEELLIACTRGERHAWARLVETKSRLVYYAIHSTFRAKEVEPAEGEVEGLHNEVFASLFADQCRKLVTFEGRNGCTLASWIRLIAVRTTLTHLSRRGRLLLASDCLGGGEEDDGDPLDRLPHAGLNPEEEAVGSSEVARLRQAMASLSEADRLFATLHFLREMALSEVAAMMGITTNTAYTRKHRVLKRLRAALEGG